MSQWVVSFAVPPAHLSLLAEFGLHSKTECSSPSSRPTSFRMLMPTRKPVAVDPRASGGSLTAATALTLGGSEGM